MSPISNCNKVLIDIDNLTYYLNRLVNSIPVVVYETALMVFIIGILVTLVAKSRGYGKGTQSLTGVFLLEYVGLLVCSTMIFRRTRDGFDFHLLPFWHYAAFYRGDMEYLPELIMNILVFIPIGLCLSLIIRGTKIGWIIASGATVSVCIEIMQLIFRKGCAEIDDVFHNTLGCLLGYGTYRLIFRRK